MPYKRRSLPRYTFLVTQLGAVLPHQGLFQQPRLIATTNVATGNNSAKLIAVKLLRSAIFLLIASCLLVAQAPAPRTNVQNAAPAVDKAIGSATSTLGIPTFYANARQVIVEADAWKPVDKKHPDTNWMPQGTLDGAPAAAAGIEKSMPPPARGLTASDFHVFDIRRTHGPPKETLTLRMS